MVYTKVFFENRAMENERLELTDKNSLYFLGENLLLRNCTLITKVSGRNVFIDRVRFIDCTLEVKQQLNNYQQWICASLKGCRFKGHFRGNDFGHWPEYGGQPEYQFGALKDCDFSEARLDACRFHSCDLRTLQFPRWPCFTLLEPLRHASELRRVSWPGSFGSVAIEHLHEHPSSTVALSFYSPSAARFFRTTEEELKAAIERFDCFYY